MSIRMPMEYRVCRPLLCCTFYLTEHHCHHHFHHNHYCHFIFKVDSTRLHALTIEGATVPVTSALKNNLGHSLNRLMEQIAATSSSSSSSAPVATAQPSEVGANSAASGGGKPKRGPKAPNATIPGLPTHAILTFTSDEAYSSDEGENGDEEQDQQTNSTKGLSNTSQLELVSSSSSRKSTKGSKDRDFVFTTLSSSNWSPLPVLWPPALTVVQVPGGSFNPPERSASQVTNTSSSNEQEISPGSLSKSKTSS